jgi:hypothetical protein
MDLEQIIDELVYRNERRVIDRVRGFVDYDARLKEAEIARCWREARTR